VAEHPPLPVVLIGPMGSGKTKVGRRVARTLGVPFVSLGGGAILDEDTQNDLRQHPVVLLTVTAEAVAARISTDARPLLADGIENWQRIYDERAHIYESLASVTFDTSTGPIMQIADRIATWAKEKA
jgi:shikimate kinase